MLRVRNRMTHALDGIAPGDVGDVPHTAHMRRLVEAGELELVAELAPPRVKVSGGEASDIDALRARFDEAWARRQAEHAAEVDALRAELDALRDQLAAAQAELSARPAKSKKGAPVEPEAPTAPAKE